MKRAREVITDPNVAAHLIRHGGLVVKIARPQIVRRGWIERLFARPWRPLIAVYDHCPVGPNGCLREGRTLWVGRELYEEAMTPLRDQALAWKGERFHPGDILMSHAKR